MEESSEEKDAIVRSASSGVSSQAQKDANEESTQNEKTLPPIVGISIASTPRDSATKEPSQPKSQENVKKKEPSGSEWWVRRSQSSFCGFRNSPHANAPSRRTRTPNRSPPASALKKIASSTPRSPGTSKLTPGNTDTQNAHLDEPRESCYYDSIRTEPATGKKPRLESGRAAKWNRFQFSLKPDGAVRSKPVALILNNSYHAHNRDSNEIPAYYRDSTDTDKYNAEHGEVLTKIVQVPESLRKSIVARTSCAVDTDYHFSMRDTNTGEMYPVEAQNVIRFLDFSEDGHLKQLMAVRVFHDHNIRLAKVEAPKVGGREMIQEIRRCLFGEEKLYQFKCKSRKSNNEKAAVTQVMPRRSLYRGHCRTGGITFVKIRNSKTSESSPNAEAVS